MVPWIEMQLFQNQQFLYQSPMLLMDLHKRADHLQVYEYLDQTSTSTKWLIVLQAVFNGY